MERFADRVALVTGAAQGIGRALALALAAEGARLAVCDLDEDALGRLRAEPALAGRDLLALRLDVADPQARAAFVATVRERLGPVDLLVNNAGVCVSGPFERIAGDDWTWIRGINLDAPVDLIRLVLPDLLARRTGRILNVASISGVMPQPYVASYVATKHALVGLSRALHQELSPLGVSVTVACPGIVKTQMLDHVRARGVDLAPTRRLLDFALSPEIAAKRMLDAVRRGRPFIIPNRDARWFHRVHRIWPGPLDALLGRLAARTLQKQGGLRGA